MEKKALTDKFLVIGIDGFEPRLAKKFLDQGKMPNLERFIARGACREDLVLLGAMPTVTPPLWTTLATGAYPGTHGITCFFGQHPENLDEMVYNLDSRRCKAEPLWNVFAEDAGKKTLVWHWPGSSWPPTSDSPNLHVVEGTQPTLINLGVANVDTLKLVSAAESIAELSFVPDKAEVSAGTGCVIENVDELLAAGDPVIDDVVKDNIYSGYKTLGKGIKNYLMDETDLEVYNIAKLTADSVFSPIKPAHGWIDAPEDAKEFYIFVGKGTERRPGLIVKNADGIYDTVQMYRSKKADAPYAVITSGIPVYNVRDEVKDSEGQVHQCVRHYQILSLSPDGSKLSMALNMAMDITRDDFFHPQSLWTEVTEKFGYPPIAFRINGVNPNIVKNVLIPSWDPYCNWQADCLTHFMQEGRYDIIFSHIHNVDSMGHQFWHFAKYQEEWGNDAEAYQYFFEMIYEQTDRYLGRFLPYLDQGWTMIITSDHGLITTEHHGVLLGEMNGLNVPIMRELGYTVLEKDADGKEIQQVDWSKTRAVAIRGDHIYLNLKGRNIHGIVEPEDRYDLEQQIISDLYNYRDPKTNKRVVSIALRNRDAVLLGMSGPECGDIIYFKEEGFNIIHADSLSTQRGYADTSVSPIFIAAGPGIKEGYYTDRVIRQVDVAPTIAALCGVRMPKQCEGAIVHQIIAE